MERCGLLTEEREPVEDELCTWRSRYVHKKEKKKKGPVGPAETEKEEDKLETFFCKIHEFHNPVPVAPVFAPAELPPRYVINFVPAASSVVFPAAPPPVIPVPVSASPVILPSPLRISLFPILLYLLRVFHLLVILSSLLLTSSVPILLTLLPLHHLLLVLRQLSYVL